MILQFCKIAPSQNVNFKGFVQEPRKVSSFRGSCIYVRFSEQVGTSNGPPLILIRFYVLRKKLRARANQNRDREHTHTNIIGIKRT